MPFRSSSPDLCPIHQVPLEIAYRGKKTFPDCPNIVVEGLPMRYCPICFAQGKDSAQELDAPKSGAFIAKLRALIEKSDFSEHLGKPNVAVRFNPVRATLDGEASRAAKRRDFDEDIAARLDNFVPQKPLYSLDRLVLSDETMSQLRHALALLEQQKLIYETWNLQSIDRTGRKIALNFYGEPGTGKTLAADAIANRLGKEILIASYAEMESKYVGETPKNIRAAFRKASETQAVLFFDEADSILGKRLTHVAQSSDHSVNLARSTMLLELDRFDGVVIFASNLVRNYDGAFLRRMLAHIEFPLPSADLRLKIWKAHLPPQLPVQPDLNFDRLVEASEGASGGDIKNAVLLAASYAATKPKGKQIVEEEDFVKAIRFVMEGKRKAAQA
ncbi:MAG: ATP-binding protein [Chloroherpetonaceae bacterium]|nr:ATP-binding protein [Chloroherpetonaceae bacterium]MDW8436676.1 ATP-binding protein [Chloroherpetonaceae bacterium]